jgi:RNA polymerase subunit RPABC4/transcription elongation factor Spt4
MDSETKHSRRKVLKAGITALAVVPLAGISEQAFATQNTAVRNALKFQLMPNGVKQCKVCINFLPNKDKPNNDVDVNGCKLYPGDTEICPHCYCNGFVQNPAATAAGAAWSPWAPPAK